MRKKALITAISILFACLPLFLYAAETKIDEPQQDNVTTTYITDDTIVNADINSAAAIATSKLSGAVTSIASHGLGTIATQAANNVSITGGAISGITDLAVADGGTGTSTGSITGTTALTFAAGGTAQNVTLTPSTTGYTILNGSVGIGTTGPSDKLHVSGYIRSQSAAPQFRLSNASNSLLWSIGAVDGSTNKLHIYEEAGGGNEGYKVTVDTAGNVGIGTAVPGEKLTLAGGNMLIGPSDAGKYLSFYDSGYKIAAQDGLEIYTGLADKIRFLDGTTENVRIDGNGNVGIGTTGPGALLHLNKSTRPQLRVGWDADNYMDISDFSIDAVAAGTSDYLTLKVGGDEKLRIKNDGSVGIGTTGPSAKLHVRTGTDENLWVRPASALITAATGIGLHALSDTISDVSLAFKGDKFVFLNGNVGIGTTSPGSILEVVSGSSNVLDDVKGDPLTIVGPSKTNTGGNIVIQSNDVPAVGNNYGLDLGGSIQFGGRNKSASPTLAQNWAAIRGRKEGTADAGDIGYLSFETRPASSGLTEKMRITSTGNVGIGTTGPGATLEINGNIKWNGANMNPTNLVPSGSGGMELWPDGTSTAPFGWNLSGTGATIARDGTNKKIGAYGAAITYGSAMATLMYDLPFDNYYVGRSLTIGGWVKTSTANQARIQVNFYGATTISTPYHSGSGNWEFLTVSGVVDSISSYTARNMIRVESAGTAYFDGVTLVEGPTPMAFAEGPVVAAMKGNSYQDNTTNRDRGIARVERGWGFALVADAGTGFTETVTFATAFATIPVVVVTPIGGIDGSDPTNPGQMSISASPLLGAEASAPSISNFVVRIWTTTTFSGGGARRIGYQWIAIGTD